MKVLGDFRFHRLNEIMTFDLDRKNFENWFYMYQEIAELIYRWQILPEEPPHLFTSGLGRWINHKELARNHMLSPSDLGKILRRGVEYGAIEGLYSCRLSAEGKKFYEETFVGG